MQEPLEEMFIDLSRKNDVVRIQGGTCLEYDATMPSKFLVGTESGNVISCSRKGKLPGERIVGVFPAHIGPVCALKRNPFFPKCFLTVGDWSAKIWSEDGRESPIIWTPYYKEYLTSGCWSATRPSVFFVTKENGTMDVWDLMHKMKSPVYTIGISSEPIYCVSAQEKGEFVAVGTKAGWLTVMRLGSGLVNQQRNEKASFASTIEHGIKREKILETKEREKKLQKKLMENLQDKGKDDEILEITEAVMEAERRFFDTVQEEIKKLKEFSMKLNQSQKRLKFIDKKGKEPAKMDAGGDMVRPVRPQSKRTAEGQRRALQAVASVETEHSDETVSDGHPFNLEKNPSTTAEENNAAASAAATAAAPLPPSPPPAAAAVTAVAAVAEVLPNAVEASTFEDESAMSVGGVSTEDSVAHSKNVDPGATVDSDKPRSEETVNLNDYPEMESHQMTNQVTVESGSTLDHLQQASIEPLLEEVAPEDEKRDSEIHEAPNSDHVESESVKHDSET